MGSISMVESRLPPGFRFHPRDDELVLDYLSFKLTGGNNTNAGNIFFSPMLIDIDLNKCEPWDLPEIACVGGKDWYFYSLRDRKYATGQRTNRATQSGYWKATGKDRSISRKGALVGMRKTLVFYQGRAPKGKKTEWVMHEFRMEGVFTEPPKFSLKEDWVLCKVFHKSKSANPRPNIDSFLNESATVTMPTLVDSSYINFDQSEQISNFCNMGPPVRSFNDSNNNNNISIGGILELGSDRKAIKAMLNNITKFEGQMENYMFNPF